MINRLLSVRRWRREFTTPSRVPTRALLDYWHSSHVRKILAGRIEKPAKAVFVWDCNLFPITFDFVWDIFFAYHQLSKLGYLKFDVLLACGRLADPLDPAYSSSVTDCERIARITNLIAPLARQYSCVSDVKILDNSFELDVLFRRQGDSLIYPYGYSASYKPGTYPYFTVFQALKYYEFNKSILPCIRTPAEIDLNGLFAGNEFFDDLHLSSVFRTPSLPYLTLTIRDYGYHEARNISQYDLDQASALAKRLGFLLVIVPDDFKKLSQYSIPEYSLVASEARRSLLYRIALYSRSEVNIFVPSGPASLSLFIRGTKTIIVNFGAGGIIDNFRYYKNSFGMKPADQPFAFLGGYLMWSQVKNSYNSDSLFASLEYLDRCALKFDYVDFGNPSPTAQK